MIILLWERLCDDIINKAMSDLFGLWLFVVLVFGRFSLAYYFGSLVILHYKIRQMLDRVVQANSLQIAIAQDLSLSHAGTVWDGALTMVYYWNKNLEIAGDLLRDKSVLELGSGTGIVGLSSAAFGAKRVYLTDLPEYLHILHINKAKNDGLFHKQNQTEDTIQVRRLQWDNKEDLAEISKIDTIVGSELAYDKQNVIELMNTILYYKTVNPQLRVMISYQKYPQLWKNLAVKFSEYFPGQFSEVEWKDLDEDYRDEQIGILYMV